MSKQQPSSSFALTVCPISVVVFVATALVATDAARKRLLEKKKLAGEDLPPCRVVFVLGDPGSGKGTTCQLLEQRLGWAHLSAGDLLRAERSKDGPLSREINTYIDQGQLVPSEVTCRLLRQGMLDMYRKTRKTCFVIDGFPRSFSNASVWEESMAEHKVGKVVALPYRFLCVLTRRI
jgi:UMP-CMP kinase